MQEVKLTKNNLAEVLQMALDVLRKGGVVVYPTETSYGLGCDFFNDVAMRRVYDIKQRDKNKPLPVLVPDFVYALSLADVPPAARKYLLELWPGPLTVVLPFKHCNWKEFCFESLAMRVSKHPFASQLALNFGHPLVTTSANISDQAECYTPADIRKSFRKGAQPDLFINAGTLPKRKPTTIISFDKNGDMKVLRQGQLKIKKRKL